MKFRRFSQKALYDDPAYLAIRKSLDSDDLKKIERVEQLCVTRRSSNGEKEFARILKEAYRVVYVNPPRRPFAIYRYSSLRKLAGYLVYRAGELRGVRFPVS